jgi:GNAT superfamily N-acetyltransferase
MEASRRATADDVPVAAQLARRLRSELDPMKGAALWIARDAVPEPLEQSYASFLDRDDATLAVGTLDEVVVGVGAVEVETLLDGTRLGVVRELFVEPGARAVGVGESILATLSTFCRDRGCRGIDAMALPGDRASKNFFEQQGLSARALIMHRELSDPA